MQPACIRWHAETAHDGMQKLHTNERGGLTWELSAGHNTGNAVELKCDARQALVAHNTQHVHHALDTAERSA